MQYSAAHMRPPTDDALVLGNLREYRHKWYRAKN